MGGPLIEPLPLLRGPAPVTRFDPGGLRGRLWVWDEGRVGDRYGGNKVRKLGYLLADAAARGATDLVTFGAVGSHHVLATALFGEQAGLRVHALLFGQPDTPHVRAVAARSVPRLASYAVMPDPLRGAAALAALVSGVAAETGRVPVTIPVGGSNALGTTGWVDAGLELAARVAAGELAKPARIFVPVGTGGTAAGLWAGLALAGLDAEVVGVRVVPRMMANRGRLTMLARAALAARGQDVALGPLRLEQGWFCGGYGHTDARVRALLARGLPFPLEGTYTAKALGAALEELAHDELDALWVQTASALDPAPGTAPLPPELAALLTQGTTT